MLLLGHWLPDTIYFLNLVLHLLLGMLSVDGLISIVNLSGHFLRGPAVVLLKGSIGVALPRTWGCMPSVPSFMYGSSPSMTFIVNLS